MSDSPNNNDLRTAMFILGIIGAVVLGYIILTIVSMLVSLVVICLIAGAVYFGATTGYKVAKDNDVWENRRIAKHKALEIARQREKAYFSSQDQEFMTEIVDSHYNDEARKLYDEEDPLAKAAAAAKKVKDIFK